MIKFIIVACVVAGAGFIILLGVDRRNRARGAGRHADGGASSKRYSESMPGEQTDVDEDT